MIVKASEMNMSSTQSYLRIAYRLLVGLAALAAGAVYAQEEADAVDAGGAQTGGSAFLEEVVVTGSRIRRSNAESAIPLQVLSADDLLETGATDLAEAVLQLPGVSPGVSPTNSNNLIQTSGLSTVSLRRLGDDRTLVLINGKRAVSNSGNSDRVSLSTLPVGFVERTEITTGGASAIYGSDAIAGVANFILEDDFEGVRIDLRHSSPEASGGSEERLNLLAGQGFRDDRGYLLFGASFRNEDMVRADDTRPDSVRPVEFDDPATGANDTFANEINAPGCDPANEDRHCFLPSFSTSTPGGVFEGGDAWYDNGRWFNDQSLQPADRTGSQDFFADYDGFNFRPGRTLLASREIANIALTGSYDFRNGVGGSLTASYSSVDTVTAGGYETLNDDDAFGILDAYEIGNIAAGHPFIPFAVEETRSGSVSYDRRLVELGEQSRINERETMRFIADLGGSFDNSWDWELYGTFGKFNQAQQNPNEVNFLNAQYALDIESDGSGGFRCVDPQARAAGCAPLNIFGVDTISPQAADYIRYNGFAEQERRQTSFGGAVNGDLFDLPTGPVRFAAGAEYRSERQDTRGDPDGDIVGGHDGDPATDDVFLTSLATFPSVSAGYDVYEVFFESDIPVIPDILDLQSAVRAGTYDTVGSILSYNIGSVWSPAEDIQFRVQYSHSQRAPNLTEFFSPSRPDADSLRDPCDEMLADGSGLSQPDGTGGENADLAVVRANCLATPGIQAYFADPDNAGEPFEFDGSVQGPNAGNPNLHEETADTLVAGFVYRPSWLEGFTFIADYYEIEIEDAITSVSTQDTVDLCYSASDFPNNRFCDVITRNPFSGEVVEVINYQENLNEERVSGLDVTLLHEADFDAIPGDFKLDVRYSRYFDWETSFAGIGDVVLTTSPLGEIETGEDEWRARLRYSLGDFRATYTVTHLAGGVDDLLNDPDPSDDRYFSVGGQSFHRLYLSYYFGDNPRFSVYGGVNNLFDDAGPLLPTGLDNGGSRNIDSNLNDVLGREWYAGLRITF